MALAGMDTIGATWLSEPLSGLPDDAGRAERARPGAVLPFPAGRGEQPDHPDVARRRDGRPDAPALERDGAELATRFEADEGLLWCYQKHPDRPCFTPGLLREVQDLQRGLRERYAADGGPPAEEVPIRYLVWASTTPGVFNLGGDLDLFVGLIRTRDDAGLRRYAKACVDVCYLNAISLGLPLVTVHLVQGDALGGGFESVLSSDVIVAEEGSQFGLPEVLFGLFPGMGAYSFLSRRLGAVQAERMILSGRVYTAEELAEMGVVDVLAPRGEGEAALRGFVADNRRRHALRAALAGVRRRCNPVTYEEMSDVVELWVRTALTLDETDLRRMQRLAAAQLRRHGRARCA